MILVDKHKIYIFYFQKGVPKAIGFFNGNKDLLVKAGETLKIAVPFQSSPKPTVIWSKVKKNYISKIKLK